MEGLADGGGICISGSVYEQVESKLALTYEYMGEQTVKNINKPIRVYRVREQTDLPALAKFDEKPQPLPLPDKPSLAVLPFTNMSSDPEQEYFSDGITEDLITDFSKVSGLFVISRNSVFTYKGKVTKVEQVGQELGVRYVLEGSIRKAGNRVRITAQLIDAASGFHVWAERYDRDLQDIFAVQDEVTQQIVAALKVKLTTVEQDRLGRQPTTNLEAYDCYLRGLELYAQRTQEANGQARQMFEHAAALDPQFATAYAFLGRTYLMELVYQWNSDLQTQEQLFAFGQKAVALDDSQPAAHETLALAHLGKKQHTQGIAEAEKAIALDPNYADAYVTLADVLCFAGQPEPAVGLVEQAMRLNPRYPPFYLWSLAHAYRLLGRSEEAITASRELIRRNPDHLTVHVLLAATYSELGREEEARAEAAEVLRINPNYSLTVVQEGMPYKDSAPLDRQLAALRKAGLK